MPCSCTEERIVRGAEELRRQGCGSAGDGVVVLAAGDESDALLTTVRELQRLSAVSGTDQAVYVVSTL